MTPTRYPLQWPPGWKRTPSYQRKSANFSKNGKRLSIFDSVERVLIELDRFGAREGDVVISTNVETRLDGLPRSDRAAPADPGVCVYWRVGKQPMKCMAVDRYDKVADNLAAVAATLDAMRAIERHGGAAILDRAFTGFTALPAPVVMGGPGLSATGAAAIRPKRPWRDVLGYGDGPVVEVNVTRLYRQLALTAHADRGGDDTTMSEINVARDEALKELS